MATTPPPWSSYWPSGVTASQLSSINKSAANFPFLDVSSASSYKSFLRDVEKLPDSLAAKTAAAFGGPEKYKAAADAYNLANLKYTAEVSPGVGTQQRYEKAVSDQIESTVSAEQQGLPVAKSSESILRDQRFNSVRTQLENQYNNLVKFDPRLSYQGRSSDLPAIFNQQAAQLADAGVSDITNLRNQDGRLVDLSTGKVVTNSNLGGQIAVDRDTGVQKWGDIFSGVKGGANYGITFASDGSPIFFPAWEKTKSPIAQVGMEFLEPVITPIATVAGYAIGGPVGAGVGNSVGQFLATGQVEVEQAILAAGTAYVGGELLGGTDAAAAGEAAGTGITPGTSGEGFTAAGSSGFTAPPNYLLAPEVGASVAASTPSLLGPSEVDLLGGTDFSRVGETGVTPGASGEGIQVVTPPGGGAATIPGIEAPGLSAMGGAQGITVPIQGGGVVSEMGFVPPGATPSLGDPSSFINNPDYLGSPVISEDYLAVPGQAPAGLSVQDALRGARLASSLFGQQPQQGLLGGGTAPYQAQGVDYSGLLSLLQGKARTPGVSPLIAPVVNPVASPYQSLLDQPMQYQPLTRSLL